MTASSGGRGAPPRRLSVLLLLLLAAALPAAAGTLGHAFTYQGALRDGGQPANGPYDLQFELYPDPAGSAPLSLAPVEVGDVAVVNGVFSARVDFGFGQFFESEAMFLEVRVRPGASGGAYTALLPRQELTPTPFALHAASVRDGSVDGSKIEPNSVQARVTGTCPSGSPVLSVGSDGGVQCDDSAGGDADDLNIAFLDSIGNVGQDLSMVLGRDGTPRLAYYDAGNGDLKYLRCRNALCNDSLRVTIDAGGVVGSRPSIVNAVNQNGFAAGGVAISYYDQSNSALKVARCAERDCASPELRTIDTAGVVGTHSSVHLNLNGNLVTAYRDVSNQQLAYATCGNTGCIQVSGINVVDTAGNVGENPVLLADPNGRPVMIYTDVGNNALKFARCTGGTCSSASAVTLSAATLRGAPIALAFRAEGTPLIAATDVAGTVHLVDCSNETCSAFTLRNLGVGPAGALSLAVGPDGVPMLAYYWTTNQDVRYVRCRTPACTGGVNGLVEQPLATIGDVGASIALVVPPDQRPAIAYYDATNGDLRLIKCPNEWCSPYFGAK